MQVRTRAHLCLELEVPEEEVGHLLVVTRTADEERRQLRQPAAAAAAAAPVLAPLCLPGVGSLEFDASTKKRQNKNGRIFRYLDVLIGQVQKGGRRWAEEME